jgi:pilus assembly protein Flp/PilA
MFKRLLKNEDGATAIEYGLIAALIAVAAITAMQALGDNLNATFERVSTELVQAGEDDDAGGGE